MIIPNIWENKKCSKPPTRYGSSFAFWDHRIGLHCHPTFLEELDLPAKFDETPIPNMATFRANLCKPTHWTLVLGICEHHFHLYLLEIVCVFFVGGREQERDIFTSPCYVKMALPKRVNITTQHGPTGWEMGTKEEALNMHEM